MNVVRFPLEEVSSDYGDIILDSVTGDIEAVISINGTEVLHEIYTPDISGMVYIRDVGSLAVMYKIDQEISLDNGMDGSSVNLDISLQEGSETFASSVKIYQCDAATGDTLAVSTLKRMPLTRVTNKVTGIGRSEFVSFYGDGEIKADVVFYSNGKDDIKTVIVGNSAIDDGKYYRYDVSPSIIATLCSIIESDLISYVVYKTENESISFKVAKHPFLNQSTFVFRNIFGAQETFTCVGDHTSERKWTRNYATINHRQKLISRDMAKTITVNTGYIDEETTGILEDLLNSQNICYLEEGVLRDVSIIEESFKVTSRKDELISVEFKYRYSSNNQMQFRTNKHRIFDFTFDESFN